MIATLDPLVILVPDGTPYPTPEQVEAVRSEGLPHRIRVSRRGVDDMGHPVFIADGDSAMLVECLIVLICDNPHCRCGDWMRTARTVYDFVDVLVLD